MYSAGYKLSLTLYIMDETKLMNMVESIGTKLELTRKQVVRVARPALSNNPLSGFKPALKHFFFHFTMNA